jgi:hypothetical protein
MSGARKLPELPSPDVSLCGITHVIFAHLGGAPDFPAGVRARPSHPSRRHRSQPRAHPRSVGHATNLCLAPLAREALRRNATNAERRLWQGAAMERGPGLPLPWPGRAWRPLALTGDCGRAIAFRLRLEAKGRQSRRHGAPPCCPSPTRGGRDATEGSPRPSFRSEATPQVCAHECSKYAHIWLTRLPICEYGLDVAACMRIFGKLFA